MYSAVSLLRYRLTSQVTSVVVSSYFILHALAWTLPVVILAALTLLTDISSVLGDNIILFGSIALWAFLIHFGYSFPYPLTSSKDCSLFSLGVIVFSLLTPVSILILGVTTTTHSMIPAYVLSNCVISIFLTAPAEELFYRNVIQEYLYTTTPAATAVVASGLIFFLSHIPSIFLTEKGMPIFGAIVLTLLYHKTRSLPVTIIVHAMLNTSVYIGVYFFF